VALVLAARDARRCGMSPFLVTWAARGLWMVHVTRWSLRRLRRRSEGCLLGIQSRYTHNVEVVGQARVVWWYNRLAYREA
jgi:hypothetical protein